MYPEDGFRVARMLSVMSLFLVKCEETFVALYDGFASLKEEANNKNNKKYCGQLYIYHQNVIEFKTRSYRSVVR